MSMRASHGLLFPHITIDTVPSAARLLTAILLLLVSVHVKAQVSSGETGRIIDHYWLFDSDSIAVSPDELTLVPSLQELGRNLLKGRQGSIVAIHPQTGEVLCMVSNTTTGTIFNRAISAAYPPGSTFKVAQLLTMYSEGIVTRETAVPCNRGFMMGTTHVGCHRHPSPLTTVQALAQSCNAWFMTNYIRMIADTVKYGSESHAVNVWHDYMESYGIGIKLGIDLPGETRGIVPDSAYMRRRYPQGWNARTLGYVGMGQGQIAISPLQLCNLAVCVANRGWWITPYIHKATAGNNPERYIMPHRALASREAFDVVAEGMRKCVTEGTARSINNDRITICGKTGTAENPGPDNSVFIAFAPMRKPKIAVCVYVEHGGDGNKCAAPMAAEIIKTYLLPGYETNLDDFKELPPPVNKAQRRAKERRQRLAASRARR